MRIISVLVLAASWAFAQSDRGTITGTISDPAGAIVAGAAIQARHVETGALYETTSTPTGTHAAAPFRRRLSIRKFRD
jgi:hypothetical protein